MKLGRLNHIGVATPSIAASIAHYRDVMGATKIHAPFDLPDQGGEGLFRRYPRPFDRLRVVGQRRHPDRADRAAAGQHQHRRVPRQEPGRRAASPVL